MARCNLVEGPTGALRKWGPLMNVHVFMLYVLPVVAVFAIWFLHGIYTGLSKH